jgi:two-component sensor histidine kinase
MEVDVVNGSDLSCSPNASEYLLVRELTHRINNEFASVIGYASLIAKRSTNDDVKGALTEVTMLLRKYAAARRALQMPTYSIVIDASGYIRALCQSIRSAKLDHTDIELILVEHPIRMHSDRCWKLGLILSELIANSVRHAFYDRGGTIRIELSRSGPFAECRVMDSGSSRSSYVPSEGLTIVEALVKELGGTITHRFGTEGAISILLFPVEIDL